MLKLAGGWWCAAVLDSATKEPMFHKRRDGVVCERGRVKVVSTGWDYCDWVWRRSGA